MSAPSILDRKFADFLKARRGEATYRDFAKQLGIHRSTLHRLEHHQQSVTLATLSAILKRLKCSWADIFGN